MSEDGTVLNKGNRIDCFRLSIQQPKPSNTFGLDLRLLSSGQLAKLLNFEAVFLNTIFLFIKRKKLRSIIRKYVARNWTEFLLLLS